MLLPLHTAGEALQFILKRPGKLFPHHFWLITG